MNHIIAFWYSMIEITRDNSMVTYVYLGYLNAVLAKAKLVEDFEALLVGNP